MEESLRKIICHRSVKQLGMFERALIAKDITAHVMEFAVWFATESFNYFEQGSDGMGTNHFYEIESGDEVTPENIYKYWLINIKQ